MCAQHCAIAALVQIGSAAESSRDSISGYALLVPETFPITRVTYRTGRSAVPAPDAENSTRHAAAFVVDGAAVRSAILAHGQQLII